MIVEVSLHHRLEPLSGLHNRVVHAGMEFGLDFLKFGSHPLADRLALHHKIPFSVLSANVRKSQKIECFKFAFSSL